MVTDAQQKVYVLDGMCHTGEPHHDGGNAGCGGKEHIEMFHHYFFTLAPDDKYIRSIRWRRLCIWSMKQVWLSTTR
jgi:hypothetical protein